MVSLFCRTLSSFVSNLTILFGFLEGFMNTRFLPVLLGLALPYYWLLG